MKTKTKQKILKVLAICILFLGNSHLMAQVSQTLTQTVCANSLAEPYLINPPSSGSIYNWTLSGGGTITPVSTSNSITIDWGAIAGGPHILEVIESNGGCSSALVTLDITIVDGPTATAGPNSDVCVGDIYSLSSASATNQVSVLWTTSGDGTFTNVSSPNPDYTPGTNDIATGTVDLTLTSTGSGPAGSSCSTNSSTLTLTIHQVPTASAGSDDNVCAGNNYTLSGSSTNGVGVWTTSGDGTFTNTTSANSDYTPGSTDILNSTVMLTWLVTGTAPISLSCISANSSMTLTIDASPIATAGPNGDVCVGDIYSLSSATANSQVSVLWTTSGDGTFTNASLLNPDYIPGTNDIATGTVDLILTATGSAPAGSACATNSSTLNLIIHPVPTASAGTNDNVCAGNNYTLSGSSTNGTGAWTTSGTGTFTNVSSATSDYTPSLGDITAGTVLLEWSVSGSAPSTLACNSATSSMTLTIIPGPTAFAGPADNICDNIPYSLSSAAATNQVSVLWTAPLGDGTFTNTSSLNPDYTPGPGDIASGTVDLTLTVTGNSPCLPISSTMTLTVIPNPTPGPIFHN